MTKEVIIPFTCNQLKLVCHVIFPIILVSGVILSDFFTITPQPLTIVLVVVGYSATTLTWIFTLSDWAHKGKFPSFRCKCDFTSKEKKQ
jgi:hypothetical protein